MAGRPIDEARNFLTERVLLPPIKSERASAKLKSVTKSSLIWLQHFDRIGDLLTYMDRFDPKYDAKIFHELKDAGFETFEDVREELIRRFV